MSDVSCNAIITYFSYMEKNNIAVDRVIDDLKNDGISGPEVSEKFLRQRRNRVPWDFYINFHNKVDDYFDRENWLEEMMEDAFKEGHSWLSILGAVARLLFDPVDLYFFAHRWNFNLLFSNLTADYEQLPDGRLYFKIQIPQENKDSHGFFRTCKRVLQHLPGLMRLDDAKVEMKVEPRCAEYFVNMPHVELSTIQKLKKKLRRESSLMRMGEYLYQQEEKLLNEYHRIVESEKEQSENAKLFQHLMNQANEAFFVINGDGTQVIHVNEAACDSLGRTQEEVMGLGLKDISSNCEDPKFLASFVELMKKREI